MKKSILSVLIISLILLLAFPIPAFAAETGDVIPSYEKFENTNVIDDLTSAGVDLDAFKTKDEVALITFQEFAYSYYGSNMGDFGLYVYIYNPSGKAILTDSKSSIMIAVSYDEDGKPNDYEKFSLVVCSRSTGEYSNLFYKFRVVDHISAEGSTIKQRVSKTSSERRYDVSEFELDFGNNNIEAYGVGGTFKFSGYAKGFGKDKETDESTLRCEVTDLETVTLDVHPTYYRTGVYDGGTAHPDDNHRYQINSVYFSVDNRLLEEYGKLQKIKAEWWEYNTSPILVTDNTSVYNALLSWVGVNIGNYNSSVPYSLMFGTSNQSGAKRAYYGYNIQTDSEGGNSDIVTVSERISLLSWLFLSNTEDLSVSSDEVNNYYKTYQGSGETIPGTNYSSDLFVNAADENRTAGYNVVDIDSDDLFDLISYDETHTWWDKFIDFGFSIPDTGESYKNVKPIEKITLSQLSGDNETVSKSILVNENDLDELRSFVTTETLENKTVFIFRFAVSDYYTFEANYVRDNNAGKLIDSTVYLAEQTAFLDFDIIQLTFNADGVYTVIPVVASPIDVISGIDPPPESVFEEALDKAKNWLEALLEKIQELWDKLTAALGSFKENWWKYGLLALAVIVGICAIPYIFRFIIWLIKLPFEALENTYKKKR